jgi:gluconokinase
MIVVLMGVSGSGKTKLGKELAASLGWPFFDGDDFHPDANVAKMAAGTPLTDADRWPWLDRLASAMAAVLERGGDAVLACSALRQAYRDRIASRARSQGDFRFVYIKGDYETILPRVLSRAHRYMPAALLASQFATLEEPPDAIVVDVAAPVAEKIEQIRARIGSGRAPT